jgi:mannose-6-phosphate isomerase-like protein (cupin superfamily)
MQILNKHNALHHYKWGDNCDGWVFVDVNELSVKLELMPGQTAESLHYHKKSQQFFFILKGITTFEVDGEIFLVKENEGFHIPAGKKHRIINNSDSDIEFILSSQPSTNNDRFNCFENEKN